MKRKLHVSLILGIILGVVSIGIATSKGIANMTTINSAAAVNKSSDSMAQEPVDEHEVVDGAKHPEKIPDQVAYSLFFRVICCREDEQEKRQGRAYIKRLGLNEAEIDMLVATAEEFNQRVSVLDTQAAEIKTRHHPDHLTNPTSDEKRLLKGLQKQKEDMIDDIIASLPRRLGADGSVKVKQFIKESLKRNVKMDKPRSE